MGKLGGKIAVITGATSGMALATAKLFVAEGAYVFITGRRQEQLDKAVKEIGRNVTGVQGDAGSLSDLDRLYAKVKAEKGRVDILFASAGVGEFGVPIESVTEAGFDKIINVNVKGTLFTVQKALPLMPDGGAIIMNGSIASVKGFGGLSVYNASKAAVRSFARTWTIDLKARRIRVNAVSSGFTDTAPWHSSEAAEESMEVIASNVPLGRFGTPDEIAKAVVFLASDDSSYITGVELFVDGGFAQV